MRSSAMERLATDAMRRSSLEQYLMKRSIAATAHQEAWVKNYISTKEGTSPFWRECFAWLQRGWNEID